MTRDLTKRQFLAALERNGFRNKGIWGYVEFSIPAGGTYSICRFNAGPRLREQLAYLLRRREEIIAREASRKVTP